MDSSSEDVITGKIIGAAIEVHRHLGPGLLESSYKACLISELTQLQLKIEQEKALPICYKGLNLASGYKLDLLVEEQVIVELKAVSEIAAIHKAQLLTYLKLAGCRVGLLINFNALVLKDGICRLVNFY